MQPSARSCGYEATEDVGVNPTDFGSLCLLLLHGPAPAGRLAELTGLTTGAVTGVIDRLEKGGFVRRELDPADRRKVIVVPDAERVDRDLFPHFPSLKRAAPNSSTTTSASPSSNGSASSSHG